MSHPFHEHLKQWMIRRRLKPDDLYRFIGKAGAKMSKRALNAWLSGQVVPSTRIRFVIYDALNASTDERNALESQINAHRQSDEVMSSVETLCEAARSGNRDETVSRLCDGIDLDVRDHAGYTPLHYAAMEGDEATAALLLEYGASCDILRTPNSDAPEDQSPLIVAVHRGHLGMVREMARRGAYVKSGQLLRVAALAEEDDPKMVKLLLELGAEVNETWLPESGGTPLMEAAVRGHEKIVSVLLEAGVNALATDRAGSLALHWAARGGRPFVIERILTFHRAVNLLNRRQETALHLAVQAETAPEETVRALMQAGAAVHLRDCEGNTPQEKAYAMGREDLAAYIAQIAPRSGPRYLQEARQRGISAIIFGFGKAYGLGFYPHDIDRPILSGGDYVGMGNIEVKVFLESCSDEIEGTAYEWFLSFAERLDRNEDFSLDELLAAYPEAKVVQGDPEKWSPYDVL